MKLTSNFVAILAVYLPAIFAATAASNAGELDRNDPVYRAQLEEECGPLGVMEVPEGVPESQVRHCADHPLSLKYPKLMHDHVHPSEWPIGVDDEPKGRDNRLHDPGFVPDLSGGAQFGCEKNTCWRVCDSSKGWCWVAMDVRDGPWVKCSIDSQCGENIGVTIAQ